MSYVDDIKLGEANYEAFSRKDDQLYDAFYGTDADDATTGTGEEKHETRTDDDQYTTHVQSINLTLVTTTRLDENGGVVSRDRTASIGYPDIIRQEDVDPVSLFNVIQQEFREYAEHYHNGRVCEGNLIFSTVPDKFWTLCGK